MHRRARSAVPAGRAASRAPDAASAARPFRRGRRPRPPRPSAGICPSRRARRGRRWRRRCSWWWSGATSWPRRRPTPPTSSPPSWRSRPPSSRRSSRFAESQRVTDGYTARAAASLEDRIAELDRELEAAQLHAKTGIRRRIAPALAGACRLDGRAGRRARDAREKRGALMHPRRSMVRWSLVLTLVSASQLGAQTATAPRAPRPPRSDSFAIVTDSFRIRLDTLRSRNYFLP